MDSTNGETVQNIVNFVSNSTGILTLGFVSYYLLGKSGQIASSFLKYVFHSPGVGEVTHENKRKRKVGVVRSELGDINFPLIKMNSFDVNFGFFTENFLQDTGFMKIDDFNQSYENNMSDMKHLKNIGNYWIMEARRPKDFMGRNTVHGYIESALDDVIYLFQIKNNDIIDYEEIIEDYDNGFLDFANSAFLTSESSSLDSTGDEVFTSTNSTGEEETTPQEMFQTASDSILDDQDFCCVQDGECKIRSKIL